MDLRDLVERVGREYDPLQGLTSPAQLLLRQARNEMIPWIPPGYIAQGSGGQGGPAFVPWIAVFDPDETTTAQRGMYVVYLFAVELGTVVLSLNQGVTDLIKRYKTAGGRQRLGAQADAIRNNLPVGAMAGLDSAIELPTSAARPVHYRYGNIAAMTYKIKDLPNNVTMLADLRRFITLYETALDIREAIRRTHPDVVVTTVEAVVSDPIPFIPEFKPKNDADYYQLIAAQRLVKTRKHEALVRDYGVFLANRGFQAATNVHPRDMIALKGERTWLIEAKMVRRGNGVHAAREALGQLLAYRYLHYRDEPIGTAAVFSEDIGLHSVGLLEAHGVAVVWRDGGGWSGSEAAHVASLC